MLDRGKHLIVQPDLLFVSVERLGMVTDRVWGAPDLVVEILSPKPRIGTLDERIAWFAEYGVRECWLIRQEEREVDVLGLDNNGLARSTFGPSGPIRSVVLPAFDFTLERILDAREG